MIANPYHELIILMILVLFFVGLCSFAAGVFILVRRAAGNSLRELSVQTVKLAQKGIAEDVAGLVGNAANLMDSMNQLTLTVRGVGIMLVLFGGLMIAGACVFAYLVYRMNNFAPIAG
jgi:hypothetical protein